MTLERALLRRLVEAVAHYTDDHLRRAGGAGIPHDYLLGQTMAEARALLAEPEVGTPTLRSMVGAAPDLTGGVESVEWLRRKRAAMEDNYAAYATPRSRAEAEAMVERFLSAVVALQEGPNESLVPDAAEFNDAHAALLAALTGETA